MHPYRTADLSDPGLGARVFDKKRAVTTLLARTCETRGPIVFANSLGAEDMVLTDIILKGRLPIEIFSIDTGRLPAETHQLMAEVERHYGTRLKVYFPAHERIESCIDGHGNNGFYRSVAARRACCQARKVEPLRRALAGKAAWVTGLRAEQSVTRADLPAQEWDETHGLLKLNPLAGWSTREVWAFIARYRVPYNRLHDQFYPSIGCAPCTRAVSAGEELRAGRWWWEAPESKECGLHLKQAS